MKLMRLTRHLIPLTLLATLTACGDAPTATTQSPTDTPRAGGELVVAVQADARSLDPHHVSDAASYRMIENLYSTLLRPGDTDGQMVPSLARDVQLSEDGMRCTLTLHEDVVFHSGRPLTAADVKYSLERIMREGVRSGHFQDVREIQTPDQTTVVLHLHAPSAALLTHLGHPMNAIVDRKVVEQHNGRLDNVAAGSGPFQLVRWQRDQQIVLERFEDYYLPGLPRLDRVILRPMAQEINRVNALRTGQADVVLDVSPRLTHVIERDPQLVMQRVPGTFWEYLGLNTLRPPLDDPRVRQAIAHALDREQINQLARFDAATPLRGGHLPPNHWAALNEPIYPRVDLASARTLLAQAGLEEGFSATLRVGADFDYQVNAAQVIRQQLAELGIDVQITPMPSTSFFDALNRGDFDMTVVGWVGLVDPDEWTYDLFHSQGAFNQQQYANEQVDAILEEARRVYDPQTRAALYRQAQRLIAVDAPVVSLYVNDQSSAWRNRVRDFVVHPTASTLSLRETWLDE